MGFLWYIIIGIAAGFLTGKIMRGGGFGVIINLILGIAGGVGAVGYLLEKNLPGGGVRPGVAQGVEARWVA